MYSFRLTVACNCKIQHFFFLLAIRCVKKNQIEFGSGSGSKFNCCHSGWVGSDNLGYGSVSGFSLKPVQTSIICEKHQYGKRVVC